MKESILEEKLNKAKMDRYHGRLDLGEFMKWNRDKRVTA